MIERLAFWTSRPRTAAPVLEDRSNGSSTVEAEEHEIPAAEPIDWAPVLEDAVQKLNGLNSSSEQGFLSVGGRLREIHKETQGVSTRLTQLLGGFSEGSGSSSIGGLQTASDRAIAHLDLLDKISARAIMQLGTIRDPIAAIPDFLQEFDRLVGRLRIMGIATRIESARIGLDDQGFEHLAQAVTSLGEGITDKAKEVRVHVRSIGEVVNENASKLEQLRASHHELLEVVTRDMHSNLDLLNEKHEVYVETIKGITLKSEDAIKSVNSVVHALQFHDITSQQVIHVVTALTELLDRDRIDPDSLAEVIPVCEVQAAQLRRAAQEFDSAILTIITNLGSLSNAINMMVGESAQMINFTKENGATFFDLIEDRLGGVVNSLIKDGQAIHEMVASLSIIGEMIRQMKSYMDEMAEVGTEIELLALNSRVRAAKVGDNGAALGTIAEAIQRLSTDARTQIDSMVVKMAQLVLVAEEMSTSASNATLTSNSDMEIGRMTVELNTLIATVHSTNEQSATVLSATERQCLTLAGRLEHMASDIGLYRGIASSMMSQSDALEVVTTKARATVDESVLRTMDERLEELNQRYTMETERRTHAAILQGGRPGNGSEAIEQQEDSGSNIELF